MLTWWLAGLELFAPIFLMGCAIPKASSRLAISNISTSPMLSERMKKRIGDVKEKFGRRRRKQEAESLTGEERGQKRRGTDDVEERQSNKR